MNQYYDVLKNHGNIIKQLFFNEPIIKINDEPILGDIKDIVEENQR